MIKLILGSALIALSMSGNASAQVRPEIGVGYTMFGDDGDGTWQQYGAPDNSTSERAMSATVGVTGPIWSSTSAGVDWHVDYTWLGRSAASCMCTPVDGNYDTHAHALRNPAPVNVPLAHYSGSGHTQGIELSMEPYWRTGSWRVSVIGGLFLHREDWSETVTGWQYTPQDDMQTLNVRAEKISISAALWARALAGICTAAVKSASRTGIIFCRCARRNIRRLSNLRIKSQ